MNSLFNYIPNDNNNNIKENERIHIVDITTRPFNDQISSNIKCGDIIQFNIITFGKYHIIQVNKYDDDTYIRINNGFQLFNISHKTENKQRRMFISLDLNYDQDEIILYFCVIPSSKYKQLLDKNKFTKEYCQLNYLIVKRRDQIIHLTDEKYFKKFYFFEGDQIEIHWKSFNNIGYYIQEKQYCPLSSSLYTINQSSRKASINGLFKQTFNQYSQRFLFRFNDKHQIHDIIICIINQKYHIKYIYMDDYFIKPNIIFIEEYDWILFQSNTQKPLNIIQIKPYYNHTNQLQPITV